MNNQKDLGKKFCEYRKSLAKLWTIGYNNFTISKILSGYFNRKPFPIIGEIFFDEIYYSSSIICLIVLSNLFEKRKCKKSLITLDKYLNFVNSNSSLFKTIEVETLNEEIKKDRDEIDAWKASISKICNVRDKLIAHLDKNFILKKFNFFRENEIEDKEIKDIYDLANAIITRYSLYFDCNDIFQSMSFLEKEEVINVIKKCEISEG